MDLKILLSAFFIFSSMLRSNLAAESIHWTSNIGKMFEGYVLDIAPSRSLYTNGLYECALACHRLTSCYFLNYQSSLEKSGMCEVFQQYLLEENVHRLLLPKPGFVFIQTDLLRPPITCLDVLRSGASKSGIYKIFDIKSKRFYDTYCDLTTEPGLAWTLVSSRRSYQPFMNPFFTNYPIDEEQPNWINYRLSLSRMEALQNMSSHWRITCNLPIDEVDYRDYVRAKFSEVDIIHYEAWGLCKKMEYINIRGYNCSSCLVPCWQDLYLPFHVDSSLFSRCAGAMTINGFLASEDNFGYYGVKNTAFRCTKDHESTTNWWFGGYV